MWLYTMWFAREDLCINTMLPLSQRRCLRWCCGSSADGDVYPAHSQAVTCRSPPATSFNHLVNLIFFSIQQKLAHRIALKYARKQESWPEVHPATKLAVKMDGVIILLTEDWNIKMATSMDETDAAVHLSIWLESLFDWLMGIINRCVATLVIANVLNAGG